MPEFTVKEVRMPELHLPEIKRDEIVRALSGIRVPEVDRVIAEPRRRMRNVDLRALPWRQGRVAGVDAGRLIAAAVAAGRLARPAPRRARWSPFRRSRWDAISRQRDQIVAVVRPAPRRSRRRLAGVVIALVAITGWLLFRNAGFRARLDRTATDARRRIDQMRSGAEADLALETGEPVSVTAAETVPSASVAPSVEAAPIEISEGVPDLA